MVFGRYTPLTLPELNYRPVAAKTGTTNQAKDAWTMGYTTDLAVGVWVGNTDNHPTRSLDGVVGAAPIWHDFMVAAHSDPAFGQTLAGPDGNPVAPEFVKPPGIIEAPVCAATGKRPIRGVRTITEVLVEGEGPTLACNDVTDLEAAELQAAVRDVTRNPGRFTPGAIERLNWYAAMTGFAGVVIEDEEDQKKEEERKKEEEKEKSESSPSPSGSGGGQKPPGNSSGEAAGSDEQSANENTGE
jgi:membrane peptidoglycan carboxypeptidase